MNHSSTLEIERGPVSRVRLNRPEVFNAFNEQMILELDQAFASLAGDAAVRIIVLEAQGKAFCAGADLQWMQRAAQASEADNLADARALACMLHRLYSCPQPTIAKVQGLSMGGGVGLISACDIAIAAEEAQFAVSEARLGLLPAVIGPYLIRAMGRRQTTRLALRAQRFTAAEALRLGLVHELTPTSELESSVAQCVSELMAGGPAAQRQIKQFCRQVDDEPDSCATRDFTAQAIAHIRSSAEAREGLRAFMEKRPPHWQLNAELKNCYELQ